MKIIYLVLLAFFSLVGISQAQDTFMQSWDKKQTYQSPYRHNAYGSGVHSDSTGQAFQWKTREGQTIEPWNEVKPNAYGPGVSMDSYGRPVAPSPWK